MIAGRCQHDRCRHHDHHDVYKDGNHGNLYDHYHAFTSFLILIPSLIMLCHISSSSPGVMVAIIVISSLSWYIIMRIVILSQVSSYDKQHSLNSPYHHTIIIILFPYRRCRPVSSLSSNHIILWDGGTQLSTQFLRSCVFVWVGGSWWVMVGDGVINIHWRSGGHSPPLYSLFGAIEWPRLPMGLSVF